jgi:hypothetical protein
VWNSIHIGPKVLAGNKAHPRKKCTHIHVPLGIITNMKKLSDIISLQFVKLITEMVFNEVHRAVAHFRS